MFVDYYKILSILSANEVDSSWRKLYLVRLCRKLRMDCLKSIGNSKNKKDTESLKKVMEILFDALAIFMWEDKKENYDYTWKRKMENDEEMEEYEDILNVDIVKRMHSNDIGLDEVKAILSSTASKYEAYFTLGKIYLDVHKFEEAFEFFEKSKTCAETNREKINALSLQSESCYRGLHKYGEAYDIISEIFKFGDEYTASVHMVMLHIYGNKLKECSYEINRYLAKHDDENYRQKLDEKIGNYIEENMYDDVEIPVLMLHRKIFYHSHKNVEFLDSRIYRYNEILNIFEKICKDGKYNRFTSWWKEQLNFYDFLQALLVQYCECSTSFLGQIKKESTSRRIEAYIKIIDDYDMQYEYTRILLDVLENNDIDNLKKLEKYKKLFEVKEQMEVYWEFHNLFEFTDTISQLHISTLEELESNKKILPVRLNYE